MNTSWICLESFSDQSSNVSFLLYWGKKHIFLQTISSLLWLSAFSCGFSTSEKPQSKAARVIFGFLVQKRHILKLTITFWT